MRELLVNDSNKKKKTSPKMGEYIHFGLQVIVQEFYEKNKDLWLNQNNVSVNVDIHVDGISLSKSSSRCAWPLSGRFVNPSRYRPFLIGCFKGEGEPGCFDLLLQDLVIDLKTGVAGFTVNSDKNSKLLIFVRCVIVDAPARAKILNIKSHVAAKGCPICPQIASKSGRTLGESEGIKPINKRKSLQYSSHIVYPTRTDLSFRQREDIDHHQPTHFRLQGAIESLDLDMVFQVPLDPMHVVDCGVTRKITIALFIDLPNYPSILSNTKIIAAEERYLMAKSFYPLEVQRHPRSFFEASKFKANECRICLLYMFFYVLDGIADKALLNHILLLSSAIRILSTQHLLEDPKNLDLAQSMLEDFVKYYKNFFGDRLSYVVHALLHLTEYVRRLQKPLVDFSAYPFEASFKDVLDKIHVFNNTELQQLQRRSMEEGYLEDLPLVISGLKGISINGEYEEYICPSGHHFRIDEKNNYATVMADQKLQFVKLLKFFKENEAIFVKYKIFEDYDSAYSVYTSNGILPSIALDIVRATKLSDDVFTINVNQFSQKLFVIEEKDTSTYLLQPYIHELYEFGGKI